jgi:predicted enzyme related to lactoylglutathione lyase
MSVTKESTAQSTAVTGIDIAGYLVKDPARAIAFYRDVVGLEPTEVDEQGRGAEFTLPDGSTFGVWKMDDGSVTGGFVMFAVGDAVSARARMKDRGLELSAVMETPVCYMAHGADPEGNAIIIHQRKA